MSRHRPNSRRKKSKIHRKLTPLEKQEIVTLREMGHTYKEIARRTLFSYATVEYTCTKANLDDDIVKKARAEAMVRAARETMEKATLALGSITPESLRHDVIERRDEDGKLTSVQHYGSSALQLATTYGILTDKAIKLSDRAEQLVSGNPIPLSPTNLSQMLTGLGDRVKKITQTTEVEFEGIDSLQERLEHLRQQAVEAEYEELPTDGPPTEQS